MKQASEHLQEAVDKLCQLTVNLKSDSNSDTYQQLVLASKHLLQYTFQVSLHCIRLIFLIEISLIFVE